MLKFKNVDFWKMFDLQFFKKLKFKKCSNRKNGKKKTKRKKIEKNKKRKKRKKEKTLPQRCWAAAQRPTRHAGVCGASCIADQVGVQELPPSAHGRYIRFYGKRPAQVTSYAGTASWVERSLPRTSPRLPEKKVWK